MICRGPNTQSADNRIKYPRDFAELSPTRGFYFLMLPTGETATALAAQWKRGTPVLFGAPSAKAGCQGAACDEYGAARFAVEVVQ
jgi:hypothetical protein